MSEPQFRAPSPGLSYPQEDARASLMIVAVCIGSFLSNLSASLVNIGMVDIAASFRLPVSSVQWTVTAYLLSLTVLLPVMGNWGDRAGKRRVHNLGYVIFLTGALGSALAGWMASFPLLILFRIVQGAGASMYQATNMALVIEMAPADKKGKAVGYVSTAVALGAMLGPGAGGLLLELFDWPALFWFMVPFAALAVAMAYKYIPADRNHTAARQPFDTAGAVLFGGSLYLLMYSMQAGADSGWNRPAVWAGITVSIVLALLVWRRGGRRKRAFLPGEVTGNKEISLGLHVNVTAYAAVFSALAALPVLLRTHYSLTPTVTGLILMAYPLLLVITAPLSGAVSDKWGTERLTAAGLSSMAFVLLLLSLVVSSGQSRLGIWGIAAAASFMGVAMGMTNTPSNTQTLSRANREHRSIVTSLLAVSRNTGMAVGSSLGFTVAAMGRTSDAVFFAVAALAVLIPLLHLKRVSSRGVSHSVR